MRDDNGQFQHGNAGGPGNPDAKNARAKGARMQKALDAALDADDVTQSIRRLNEIIRNGEDRDAIKAIELLLNRVFGKPAQQVETKSEESTRVRISFVPDAMLPKFDPATDEDGERDE